MLKSNQFLKTLQKNRDSKKEKYESYKTDFVNSLIPKFKELIESKIQEILIDKPFYINFEKEDFSSKNEDYKFNPRNIRFLVIKHLCDDESSILHSLIWKEFDNKQFSVRFFIKKESDITGKVCLDFYQKIKNKNSEILENPEIESIKNKYYKILSDKLNELYPRWNFKKTPNLWFILNLPISDFQLEGLGSKFVLSSVFYSLCKKDGEFSGLVWKVLKSEDSDFYKLNFIYYEPKEEKEEEEKKEDESENSEEDDN
jgi:hypothetical protein